MPILYFEGPCRKSSSLVTADVLTEVCAAAVSPAQFILSSFCCCHTHTPTLLQCWTCELLPDAVRMKDSELSWGHFRYFQNKLCVDMKHMDYGCDLDMLQDPTLCLCAGGLVAAGWRRCLLRWSLRYLLCVGQVSGGINQINVFLFVSSVQRMPDPVFSM